MATGTMERTEARTMPASTGDDKTATKTVRIAGEAATQLQTINALKDQMGEKFKSVEFLNGLVEKPIAELYEQTVKAFTEFQAKKGKKK